MGAKQVLRVNAAQLLFRDVTDFPNAGAGPPFTAANDLRITSPSPVQVQIDLTGVAAAAARQSDKTADLGASWPREWLLGACIEFETAPAAGGTVEFWWNGSPNSAAATGNSGNASGADAVFAVAGLPQLKFIGAMTVLSQVVNKTTVVGNLAMPYRYGSLIVVNKASTAFRSTATEMDETHIVLTPVIPEIQ